jgi:8-oxo-dGTP pyrophosphatase MutT (NUDIX family)
MSGTSSNSIIPIKKVYCSNCGKQGHLYKQCNDAVTSYGIILYKEIDKKLHYLLIRRKDSLSYVEFIRGRYNINNMDYILLLLDGMTIDEKNRVLTTDFDELWNMLWIKPNSKQHKKEYSSSLDKFNHLRNKKETDTNISILGYLIEKSKTKWDIPEWGFPKGRRNLYESDLDCAEREFVEESGVSKKDYIILRHINPIYEVFTGSNNIRYKHIYYIALCISDIDLTVNRENKYQAAEIGDIGWFNYISSMKMIRSTNHEKKMVLNRTHNIIKQLCTKMIH